MKKITIDQLINVLTGAQECGLGSSQCVVENKDGALIVFIDNITFKEEAYMEVENESP